MSMAKGFALALPLALVAGVAEGSQGRGAREGCR